MFHDRGREDRSSAGGRAGAALVLCVLLAPLFILMIGRPTADLEVYLLAGRTIARGQDLYRAGFGSSLHTPLPYTYPPSLAAFTAAIAWMPWRPIEWFWTALNIAVLIWVVQVSYGALLDRAGSRRLLALATLTGISALTAPLTDMLFLGQLGLILMAACLVDMLPERTRLPRGVLVGAATAVKLTPGAFILYWLVTRRYRAALIASVTTLGLWILAAAPRPDLTRTYWTKIAFRPRYISGDLSLSLNQSLNGTLHRLGSSSTVVWGLVAATAMIVGLIRARRAHRAGDEMAAVSLIAIAALLVSPVSWVHHYVWIVPIGGVLLGDGSTRSQWRDWGLLTAVFLLRLPGLGGHHALSGLPSPVRFLMTNAYVIVLAVLLVRLPITSRTGRRATTRS